MYSHAHVESAKAINLHDLSSDWINLMEKKKTLGIEHVLLLVESTCGTNSTKFFSFHGMFTLCAVKTYVENIPWKPALTSLKFFIL